MECFQFFIFSSLCLSHSLFWWLQQAHFSTRHFHTWINPLKLVKIRHILTCSLVAWHEINSLDTVENDWGVRILKNREEIQTILVVKTESSSFTTTITIKFWGKLWNLWQNAHRDIFKVRLKCILWAINCQHGLKCEPVFSIKLLSLPALNGDKLSFYCVWGCWLFFSLFSNINGKSDIIIIKIENRDTSAVLWLGERERERKLSCFN